MAGNPFDDRAATWDDDPRKRDRAATVAQRIRSTGLLRQDDALLEYGAGTGLVSQGLRESVGSLTLADSSQGMLDVLRAKVDAGIFGEARVLELDLARDPDPGVQVDVIVTVMTMHHIPDLGPVLKAFSAMLADGGRLFVVDLEREDGSFHADTQGFAGHDGFDRDALAMQLEAVGFTGIDFSHCCTMEKNDRTFHLFLATCLRGPR